jgi:predicted DNA binding CopG/RHH family protein
MKKKLPVLSSDKAAEDFVEKADLADYDLSGMKVLRFEFQPKDEHGGLTEAHNRAAEKVRKRSAEPGVAIRQTLGRGMNLRKKKRPQ